MVLVEKFFCFDLYTTGLLIGWLGLAESITSCIFSILTLENIDSIITQKEFPQIDDIASFRSAMVIVLGIYIAFNIIDLLASGLLIAGTVKRNRLLFLPWLINSLISLFFNAITIAASFYTIFSQSKTPTIIPVGVAMILIFLIYVYAYIAIYSLYLLIRRNSPNNEYSSLIEDRNGTGYPIYTRT